MARNKEFNPSERLEKARDLFWERGYHATSMQDLVKKMKINRGSMYDTYGDKHRLFIDSLYDYAQATFNDYKSAILEDQSPLDTIKNIVHRAIERSFEEDKVCMLVKSTFELAPQDEIIRKVLQNLNNDLIQIFEKLLIEAQKVSEISNDKEPKLLAQFIVGSFAGFWQIQTLYNDKKKIKDLATVLFSALH